MRNGDEKAERAKLDNYRCVILHTGDPEMCHIVPLSANSNKKNTVMLGRYFWEAMGCLFSDTPEPDHNSGNQETDMNAVDSLTKFKIQCKDIFASAR